MTLFFIIHLFSIFAERKTNMEDLNYEDFQLYFWAYIDESIVTPNDRNLNNKDFCDAVCFDCFRIYKQSNLNLDTICKQAENILVSVQRLKPVLGS